MCADVQDDKRDITRENNGFKLIVDEPGKRIS